MQVSCQIATAPVNEIPYKKWLQYFQNFLLPCKQLIAIVDYTPQKKKKRESKLMLSSRRKVK